MEKVANEKAPESYLDQIVKDTIKELKDKKKKHKVAYVFTQEQVDLVKKVITNAQVHFDDGIYCLSVN